LKSVPRQIEGSKKFMKHVPIDGKTVEVRLVEDAIFFDDGISGGDFKKRDDLLRLLDYCKSKPRPIDILVLSEESRLGREMYQTAAVLMQIIECGIRVFFYLEGRERRLDSATDKLLFAIQGFTDEIEVERIRLRTGDAAGKRLAAGYAWGLPPYGYDHFTDPTGHRVRVINPDESIVVLLVYEWAAKGWGTRKIAKQLNLDGVKKSKHQRSSAPWNHITISKMLQRPIYRGQLVINMYSHKGKKAKRPESECESQYKDELRIVSDKLWYAAQQTRTDNTTRGTFGRYVEPRYPLTGFGRCAECGSRMHVFTRTSTGRKRYGCQRANRYDSAIPCSNNRTVWMDVVDDAVLGKLHAMFSDESVVSALVDELWSMYSTVAPDPSIEIRNQLAAVEKKIERLLDVIESTDDEAGPLKTRLARHRETARDLRLHLSRVEPPSAPIKSRKTIDQRVRADFAEALRVLNSGELEPIREMLRRVLDGPIRFTRSRSANGLDFEMPADGLKITGFAGTYKKPHTSTRNLVRTTLRGSAHSRRTA